MIIFSQRDRVRTKDPITVQDKQGMLPRQAPQREPKILMMNKLMEEERREQRMELGLAIETDGHGHWDDR